MPNKNIVNWIILKTKGRHFRDTLVGLTVWVFAVYLMVKNFIVKFSLI